MNAAGHVSKEHLLTLVQTAVRLGPTKGLRDISGEIGGFLIGHYSISKLPTAKLHFIVNEVTAIAATMQELGEHQQRQCFERVASAWLCT